MTIGMVHDLTRRGYAALAAWRGFARLPVQDGLSFLVSSRLEAAKVLFLDGDEPVRPFLDALRSSDIMWDVGANIGIYAVPAAGRARSVYAFEPIPDIARRLRANARRNGAAVQVIEAALSDRSGEVDMTYSPHPGCGMASMMRRHDLHHPMSIRVRAARADELALPPPTVLKIDVEGAELAVLRGMGKLLAHVRLALIEVHPNLMIGTPGDVERLLIEAKLAIESLTPRRGQFHVLASCHDGM